MLNSYGQEGTTVHSGAELFWLEPNTGQAGNASTQAQVPVGVEIIHHPMELLRIGKLLGDMAQVPAKIQTPSAFTDVAENLPRRDYQAGNQATRAVADVFERATFWSAWFHGPTGILALQGLDAGFFIDAQHQFAVLVHTGRVQIELGDVQGFGLKIGVRAVQPLGAAMRLEVVAVEDAVDGAAAHVAVVAVLDDLKGQVLQRPMRDRQIQLGRFGGRQHDDLMTVFRGKKSSEHRCEEGRPNRPDVEQRSVSATCPRWQGRNRILGRFAHW